MYSSSGSVFSSNATIRFLYASTARRCVVSLSSATTSPSTTACFHTESMMVWYTVRTYCTAPRRVVSTPLHDTLPHDMSGRINFNEMYRFFIPSFSPVSWSTSQNHAILHDPYSSSRS